MTYTKKICEVLHAMERPDIRPHHVEAYMRLGFGTLDGLSPAAFRREVQIAVACVDQGGADAAEGLAESLGLEDEDARASFGPGRLTRTSYGRWLLSQVPIHAGDILELRCADGGWIRVRFEWQHTRRGVQPMLYVRNEPLSVLHFGSCALRWPVEVPPGRSCVHDTCPPDGCDEEIPF